jgi:hypothetical protein
VSTDKIGPDLPVDMFDSIGHTCTQTGSDSGLTVDQAQKDQAYLCLNAGWTLHSSTGGV